MANEKRLVNAEAIARKLKNAYCAECNVVRQIQCSACWVNDVLDLLEGDSVDAVEVVRCKDCKMRCPESVCIAKHCTLTGIPVDDDDFCSYGERREGE